ncbi:unnamed protein product, partial [Ceratitis capitata]
MTNDPDLDDCAFLSGGESSGRQTRQGVAVCSQRRALLVAGIVLGSLLLTALIIAYAGPQTGRLITFMYEHIVVNNASYICGYVYMHFNLHTLMSIQ